MSTSPLIREDDILDALEASRSGRKLREDNALLALVMIDVHLDDPARPATESQREFTLLRILCDLIAARLTELRAFHGIIPDDSPDIRAGLIEDIQRDIAVASPIVTGLSLLYHCYVRVEANIDLDAFASAVHVVPRTIRRYREDAIRSFSETLVEYEWKCRTRRRKDRLLSQLPGVQRSRLYGRDPELEHVLQCLAQSGNSLTIVTGLPGIGKTAFVETVVQMAVEHVRSIDFVVYVKGPRTLQDVQRGIEDAWLVQDCAVSLVTALACWNVILVIDDADELVHSQFEMASLNTVLKQTHAFLICKHNHPGVIPDCQIHLTELDSAAVHALVADLQSRGVIDAGATPANVTQQLMQSVGGHPAALRMAAQAYNLGMNDFAHASLRSVFGAQFVRLAEEVQRALLIMSLYDTAHSAPDDIIVAWPEHISANRIKALLDHRMLEPVDKFQQSFEIPAALRQFIVNDPVLRQRLSTLVSARLSQAPDLQRSPRHALVRLLYTVTRSIPDRLSVSTSVLQHFALWLLEMHDMGDPEPFWPYILDVICPQIRLSSSERLFLAYGITLRMRGRIEQAQSVFEMIIMSAGRSGQFDVQTRALIELATTCRLRGGYQDAEHYLLRAERAIPASGERKLRYRITHEYAQIAIDMMNGAAALRVLENSTEGDVPDGILWCEALFVDGRFDLCLSDALRLLPVLGDKRIAAGRLHNLIGRVHLQKGEFSRAINHLRIADAFLELTHYPLALARTRSNLGVAHLQAGAYDDARSILRDAENLQRALGDERGLIVTQHNLREIDKRLRE